VEPSAEEWGARGQSVPRPALRRPHPRRHRLPSAGDAERSLPLPWRPQHRPPHRGRHRPHPRRPHKARHAGPGKPRLPPLHRHPGGSGAALDRDRERPPAPPRHRAPADRARAGAPCHHRDAAAALDRFRYSGRGIVGSGGRGSGRGGISTGGGGAGFGSGRGSDSVSGSRWACVMCVSVVPRRNERPGGRVAVAALPSLNPPPNLRRDAAAIRTRRATTINARQQPRRTKPCARP
jgi:hypothetical protein